MKTTDESPYDTSGILAVMRRACDYQLGELEAGRCFAKSDINYEWVLGVFYTGLPAMAKATGEQRYLDAAQHYAESRNWQLDKPETRHADWQCIGQVYLELYLNSAAPRAEMIAAIQKNIDLQMHTPRPGREDWWWCDALFMAPPVLTRLFATTGDRRYIDFLEQMYWDAAEFLYNPAERLFFRDKNYFDAQTASGRGVYWSRGNGWVLAGLARLMDYLPKGDPARQRFEQLFRAMAFRLAELQQADGFWRTSLLDADEFPQPESSGTALVTYALAWSVNEGLLERATFMESALRGWDALAGCVNSDGRLGCVQVVAAAPGAVTPEDTREYAVGALLLAGSELIKLTRATDS